MPVVIRLMRAGAKKRPFFRMVAADSRRQRDGRFLEILGHYNPMTRPYELMVHKDKVEAWLSKGAQPSEQAASLLRSVGIAPQRPTPPKREAPASPKPAKKVLAAKRAAPRKQSARKVERKIARKATRAAAKGGTATKATKKT